eukprot:comp36104_c0_seq1/m.47323 comp36104_c0_seq1/g.47323  ORF comp36104_c0_seq1/g.47323 comp36104_c0_seq1/m.47323 type:complete len:354 (-) comp36104_c0_seq1:451-1512(-)
MAAMGPKVESVLLARKSTEGSSSSSSDLSDLNLDLGDLFDLSFIDPTYAHTQQTNSFDLPTLDLSAPMLTGPQYITPQPVSSQLTFDTFGLPNNLFAPQTFNTVNPFALYMQPPPGQLFVPPSSMSLSPSEGSRSTGSEEDSPGADGQGRPVHFVSTLTEAERRTLTARGYVLDECVPLTKAEERRLRQERRKLRNKESAKESRRKKVDYVKGLERRVELCTAQSVDLQRKCNVLEANNTSLLAQVQALQQQVHDLTARLAGTKGHSLPVLVFLFAFCFVVSPSFLGQAPELTLPSTKATSAPHHRVLLSVPGDVVMPPGRACGSRPVVGGEVWDSLGGCMPTDANESFIELD